jgi:allantoate deiminase/N-carbamoyl-L-amino-acid hydrolase
VPGGLATGETERVPDEVTCRTAQPGQPQRPELGQRVLDLADDLARSSEQSGALTCTFFSDAHRVVCLAVAGLVRGPGARTLIIDSHYDTVRNAEKYNGRLGILCGLAVLESLRDARLPFAVELIGFRKRKACG